MGIKSLMHILEEEDVAVRNICLANSLAERYEEKLNHAYACSEEKEYIKYCMDLIEEHRAEASKYEEELIAIRDELKNYIMQLLS